MVLNETFSDLKLQLFYIRQVVQASSGNSNNNSIITIINNYYLI